MSRKCYFDNTSLIIFQGVVLVTLEPDSYILTVDEKYWNRLRQQKYSSPIHSFVRRNKVGPKKVRQLLFYVTKKKRVLGSADFVERLTESYENLWKEYSSETCFESFEEYKIFVDKREIVTFLRFCNFKEIANPKSKEEVANIVGSMRGFGAGKYLDQDTAIQLV